MKRKKRAGSEGKFKRAGTAVVSASLTAEEIARLNELAADHGGAGRAIQVAVEHLHEYGRRRPRRIMIPDGKKIPFSFAVFPRTHFLINSLSSPTAYVSMSNVIRACMMVLEDLSRIFHPSPNEPREAS
jgi:hypothetical protein